MRRPAEAARSGSSAGRWRPPCPSAGGPFVSLFHELGVVNVLTPLVELPGRLALAGAEETHPRLELDELLVGAALVLERLELPGEPVARDLLVELRGRDGLPLGGLDLLGHPLEGLE